MKILNIIIAFAILSFTFISCDKVEAPFKEEIEKPDTEKKVLLEDFTGHKCVNCPAAHDIAHDLTDAYGEENLIVVSIHTGFFATPSGAPYDYDFRTEAGAEYASYFGVQVYPSGMVDRVNEEGNYVLDKDKWGTEVAQQFEEEVQLGITINPSLEGTKLSGEITIDFITDFSSDSKLLIWIVEDSIIKPQTAPGVEGGYIEDYVHNHVLRDAINGSWGEALPSTTYAAEASITMSFSNYQLGDDWVAKQLAVIAFVYDEESKKVIQVEKKKIIE